MSTRKPPRPPLSMQWRMTAFISSVFLVLIVAFGWISLANLRHGFDLVGDAQLELTRRIAGDLDSKLQTSLDGLESKSRIIPAAVRNDPGAALRLLQGSPVLKTAFFDKGLFLFDHQGRLLAADASDAAIAADPEFQRWVRIAIKLDEPLIAQPCRCGGSGPAAADIVLPMVSPFHTPDGRVAGALAGAAGIYRESLFGSIPLTRLGGTGYFFVTSWDGRTLVHPDQKLLLQTGVPVVPATVFAEAKHGFRGPVETHDQNGEPVLATFVKMQTTGWVLGANYPTREAFAHLHRQQRDLLLFMVLGTLAAAAATWLLMHLLVSPIRHFAKAIGDIDVAQGVSIEPVPVPRESSEMARLGKSFNELIARLNDERMRIHIADRVFHNVREGIVVTDADNRIVTCNQAFEDITGYRADEVRGLTPSVLKSGRHDAEFYREIWQAVTNGGSWRGEIWNRRKSGEIYPQLLNISAAQDETGAIAYYVGVFSDITELKHQQDRLETMATTDHLTGLPNRTLLADRLQQDVAHAERLGHVLAVAFVDLDGFKEINDREGHHVGDALLIEVAQRFRAAARLGDTAARLGGDEFVLLLTNVVSPDHALRALDRLLAAISAPYVIGGRELRISASIGVTFFPSDHSDPDTLLRHADHAMYQAKSLGRSRIQVFDQEHDRQVQSRQQLIDEVRHGIREGEFVLHYQPKVDFLSREVVGAEALIRWQHPQRGLLQPAEFIEALATEDVVIDIGEWVVAEACRQMERWRAMHGLRMPVSVNLAARHLVQEGFAESLRQAVRRHPAIGPEWLEIEILESDTLLDPGRLEAVIGECRALGFRFALDDFGTGYSSLSHLKHVSADVIKIDRSFVINMLMDADDLAMVEGIVRLAYIFKRQVVAEGVETAQHMATLCNMGCYWGQGYGIARPMPAANLPAWIADYSGTRLPGVAHG